MSDFEFKLGKHVIGFRWPTLPERIAFSNGMLQVDDIIEACCLSGKELLEFCEPNSVVSRLFEKLNSDIELKERRDVAQATLDAYNADNSSCTEEQAQQASLDVAMLTSAMGTRGDNMFAEVKKRNAGLVATLLCQREAALTDEAFCINYLRACRMIREAFD